MRMQIGNNGTLQMIPDGFTLAEIALTTCGTTIDPKYNHVHIVLSTKSDYPALTVGCGTVLQRGSLAFDQESEGGFGNHKHAAPRCPKHVPSD